MWSKINKKMDENKIFKIFITLLLIPLVPYLGSILFNFGNIVGTYIRCLIG